MDDLKHIRGTMTMDKRELLKESIDITRLLGVDQHIWQRYMYTEGFSHREGNYKLQHCSNYPSLFHRTLLTEDQKSVIILSVLIHFLYIYKLLVS